MPDLPRIAILGGGVGSVTAAVHLSEEGWKERFGSITLYQQGWRLGGKGASGRGRQQRIEEHGLHIWFGFYENAFRMLHRCHQELDAKATPAVPRWSLPFKSVEESFLRCGDICLTDYDGCGWKLWIADFFDEDDDRPWVDPPAEDGDREWGVAHYLVRCLRLAADMSWSLVRSDAGLEIVAAPAAEARRGVAYLDEAVQGAVALLTGDIRRLLDAAAEAIDDLVEEGFDQPFVLDALGVVVTSLDLVVDFLRRRYDDVVRSSDALRRAWYVVDILIAIVRGVIDDGVIEEDSFAVIDDVDFRDWLLDHGAARDSVDCALVRAVVYDLAFAYEGGDPQRPSCGAGTALRGLLRTFFDYRGSLMWKMNAGMGDVVFAPLYELLVKRGVDVRFFHRVEDVRTAEGEIVEIEIDLQAELPEDVDPRVYLGLAPAGGPPAAAAANGAGVWPASPAEILKHKTSPGVTLPGDVYESWYAPRTAAKAKTTVLRKGAETDGFEAVVFGLPISCVPNVAPELMAQQRWKAAVDHLKTVPTQAMQLWLNKPADALGDVDPGTVVGGFVEPYDTWADMPHLVPAEKVGDSATVAYFCNVLADSQPLPARGAADDWLALQRELVRAQALRFLRYDIATLWPNAFDPVKRDFRWELLVDPDGGAGEERLKRQYLRANVEPSERYVLSVPGSSAHRIPPDQTGFANLYAVGDWTSCILDAGCVEAAVISGMLAAEGIHRGYVDAAYEEPLIVGRGSP
jgi:uncharacterized protein with NAD-binding domain and iron-sulfur cluster